MSNIINDCGVGSFNSKPAVGIPGAETVQENNNCCVVSAQAPFRKFKAESSSSGQIPVTAHDAIVQQDLQRVDKGETGALDKLYQDIGGIANLSVFKFSKGTNLIEYSLGAYNHPELSMPDAAIALINAGFNVNATTIDKHAILTPICRYTYSPYFSAALKKLDCCRLFIGRKGSQFNTGRCAQLFRIRRCE